MVLKRNGYDNMVLKRNDYDNIVLKRKDYGNIVFSGFVRHVEILYFSEKHEPDGRSRAGSRRDCYRSDVLFFSLSFYPASVTDSEAAVHLV